MSQPEGKCPGCDETGELGAPCAERACRKRGYHFIHLDYWERAHADDSQNPDPVIGQLVGDFIVVDLIGAGGFGRVYLALQRPLLRLRGALKLIEFPSSNVMLTEALLEKFQGEAEALADLTHPNIVRLLKYGTHGERPYLVMEYVDEGATLRDEIYYRGQRNEAFTHEQLRHIFDQILNGLAAAHAQNIIHRDIKPENIMLQRVVGNPLHVRILDFGTAKFVENRADTKWPLGSPSYMAPEQVALKNLGPWSDLYAVGVMVYELLSGEKPFPGETENEIVANKMDEEFDPLDRLRELGFPSEAIDFLQVALARDPEERFQSVPEFRAALHELFDELEDLSGPLGARGRDLSALIDSHDGGEGERAASELHSAETVVKDEDEFAGDEATATPTERGPGSGDRRGDGRGGSDGGDSESDGPHGTVERIALITGILLIISLGAILMLMNTFGRDVDEWLDRFATERAMAAVHDAGDTAADAGTDFGPTDVGGKGDVEDVATDAEEDAAVGAEEAGMFIIGAEENRRLLQLAAGKFHTCALVRPDLDNEERLVRCWGANFDGELGIGNTMTIGDDEPASAAPFVTVPETPVAIASAGDREASFNCTRTATGKVLCWGSNHFGQLGYGHTRDIGDDETPSMAAGFVRTGGEALQVAIGASKYASHACVLLAGGRVRCWGGNNFGQLGYGHEQDIGDDEVPTAAGFVRVGGAVTRIAAGKYHTCAVLHDATLRCWGWNKYGQLGYGHTDNVGDDEIPSSVEAVSVGAEVERVALGRRHSCAIVADGNLRCWGWNEHGQLGYGHTDNVGDDEPPSSAGDVDVGAGVVDVTAGELHTCVLTTDGEVRCWGDNKFGQLGYGHTNSVGDAQPPSTVGSVFLGAKAVEVVAGSYHTCALLETDAVRCWGYNKFGQLGYGHTNDIGDDETPGSTGAVPLLKAD